MNKEFGYEFKRIWMVIFVIPIVGLYFVWRVIDIPSIVLMVIGLFLAVREALPLCKVLITETELHVSFLVPVRRGGCFRHEEVMSYSEMAMDRKGKKILMGGMIRPKDKKSIMIMNIGIKDFNELNSTLLELYPRPEIAEQSTKGDQDEALSEV